MLWTAVYVAWIAFEIVIAVVTRTRRGKGDIQDRGTQAMLWLTIVAALTGSGFAEHYVRRSFPSYCLSVAAQLLLLGLAIRLLAIWTLGRDFSVNVAIKESQSVNQRGFYKWIRHPSYLGLLLIFFAIGLHALNPVSLAVAFVPTTAMLLYRIQIEEAVLTRAFGATYVGYMAKTKRLVPFVY